MATHTKTLEEYKEDMESNGFSYSDRMAFEFHYDKVCYIPENAEDLDDTFSRKDLEQLCREHIDKHSILHSTADELCRLMFDSIEWESPSTWLIEYES